MKSSSSFHPELCSFIGWALRCATPSGWVVPKITNPRPPFLRAHYFENTPIPGHYSTLWGVYIYRKGVPNKNRYNLFIPIYKTINPKNGAEICCL